MLNDVRFRSVVPLLFCAGLLSLACGVAWWSAARAEPATGKRDAPSQQWAIVRIELPADDESFPPGIGADIASSQCLICHSAGMVLTQPPLKKDEWRAEIVKMRSVYGAPIPDDQVDALLEYLTTINGRQ
jgi:mono/diheme cytochrome c family protein